MISFNINTGIVFNITFVRGEIITIDMTFKGMAGTMGNKPWNVGDKTITRGADIYQIWGCNILSDIMFDIYKLRRQSGARVS